jgi:hypothetical protein
MMGRVGCTSHVARCAQPLRPSTATRQFFNLGWPFASGDAAAADQLQGGKAIQYKDDRVLPYVICTTTTPHHVQRWAS